MEDSGWKEETHTERGKAPFNTLHFFLLSFRSDWTVSCTQAGVSVGSVTAFTAWSERPPSARLPGLRIPVLPLPCCVTPAASLGLSLLSCRRGGVTVSPPRSVTVKTKGGLSGLCSSSAWHGVGGQEILAEWMEGRLVESELEHRLPYFTDACFSPSECF